MTEPTRAQTAEIERLSVLNPDQVGVLMEGEIAVVTCHTFSVPSTLGQYGTTPEMRTLRLNPHGKEIT